MENTYEKFERKLTMFVYNFARDIDAELGTCEMEGTVGIEHARAIHASLADVAGMLSAWPYAQAIISMAKENSKKKFEHLKEVYKD